MKTTEVLISKQEKFQAIRWVNLGVGLLQLYYWVSGASAFVAVIAAVNIGVWSFTRHRKI